MLAKQKGILCTLRFFLVICEIDSLNLHNWTCLCSAQLNYQYLGKYKYFMAELTLPGGTLNLAMLVAFLAKPPSQITYEISCQETLLEQN